MPTWPDGPLPRVERDDEYPNPLFFHACTDGRVLRTFLPLGAEGWAWQDDGALVPSVHCHACGCHGWWTADGWVPA